ncbi:MAG: hypothetical protein FWH02_06060 [Oscillospiraceae bacterium]|nr:hypothetical protein [Oscillospiraceae bacterium]
MIKKKIKNITANNKAHALIDEKLGEIVKDFTIGNTRIKINDAYCREKTFADAQKILADIAVRAQEHFTAQSTVNKIHNEKHPQNP